MRYYFDTSSLIKVYHPEQGSREALALYKGDEELFVSELGVLEFLSAVYRKYRENDIDFDTLEQLVIKINEDVQTRYEFLAFSPLVFEEASRLLMIYGKKYFLRTFDSIQFTFFKTYCEKTDIFVCSDKRLGSIVELDGNTILVPGGGFPGTDASFRPMLLSFPRTLSRIFYPFRPRAVLGKFRRWPGAGQNQNTPSPSGG